MPFNPLDLIRKKRQSIGIPAPGIGPAMPQTDLSQFRTPDFNPNSAAAALNPEPPATTMLARDRLPAPSSGPAEKEAPYMTRRLPGGAPRELPEIASEALSRPALPPPAATGIPGGETAANAAALSRPVGPMTRQQQVDEAKQAYLAGTPGRFKSFAINALKGLASGGATGGGLGAALGGALAGGAAGAIDPRGARERQFEREQLPKITGRFAYEDAQRSAAAAEQKAAQDYAYNQARIGDIQSQINSRTAADALNQKKFEADQKKPIEPKRYTVDGALLDDQGKVLYQSGNLSAEDAEAERVRREGTREEIARGSLAGRLDSLKQQLTPNERRLIENPTVDDDPEAVKAAQSRWQRIQDKEFDSILRDTGERNKVSASEIRRGSGGKSSQSGGRSVADLSSKFPELKRRFGGR